MPTKNQDDPALKDYSFTMNNTDCRVGLGGRLTKYHRHSVRISQPFLDFFSFEIAAANAFILRRGKDVSYTRGVRRFAEEVIEETVHSIINSDEDCWILRKRKRKFPKRNQRIGQRFTNKPLSELSILQIRNELGQVASEADVNYNYNTVKNETLKRERAGSCMDMLPTKVANNKSRKCFVCGGQTQFFCDGGRCKVWSCFYGRGFHGDPMDTCTGKIHVRYRRARKRLRRDLKSWNFAMR